MWHIRAPGNGGDVSVRGAWQQAITCALTIVLGSYGGYYSYSFLPRISHNRDRSRLGSVQRGASGSAVLALLMAASSSCCVCEVLLPAAVRDLNLHGDRLVQPQSHGGVEHVLLNSIFYKSAIVIVSIQSIDHSFVRKFTCSGQVRAQRLGSATVRTSKTLLLGQA